MREQFSGSVMTDAIAAMGVGAVILVCIAPALAQAPEATAKAAASTQRTPWGEPDLKGIWTEETDTPLQRPAKYADQEFFTAAQRGDLDMQRAGLAGKDQRAERGTEVDVGGSYNSRSALSAPADKHGSIQSPFRGVPLKPIVCQNGTGDIPTDNSAAEQAPLSLGRGFRGAASNGASIWPILDRTFSQVEST